MAGGRAVLSRGRKLNVTRRRGGGRPCSDRMTARNGYRLYLAVLADVLGVLLRDRERPFADQGRPTVGYDQWTVAFTGLRRARAGAGAAHYEAFAACFFWRPVHSFLPWVALASGRRMVQVQSAPLLALHSRCDALSTGTA